MPWIAADLWLLATGYWLLPYTGRVSAAPPSAERYRERGARFAAERDAVGRRWNVVANLRLAAFLVAVAAAFWALRQRSVVFGVVAALAFVAFVVLVRAHRVLGRRRRRLALLVEINEEGERRVGRDWDALPLRHDFRPEPTHPYAADLDIFGRASLFQLLDTVTTPMGAATLRAWLLAPAPPEVVRERQPAVAELTSCLDWRQELELTGRLHEEERTDPGPFLAWAEGEPWLPRRACLRGAAWVCPALLWLSVAAQVLGLLSLPLWIVFAGINLVLTYTVGGEAYAVLARAASQGAALGHDAAALGLIADAPFSVPLLKRLQATLGGHGRDAPAEIRSLGRLSAFVVPRGSLISPLLQLAALWDIHVLAAFERWQRDAGHDARAWLATLGEVEALAALAGLAGDNPDWALPEVAPAADTIAARGLGHPLLAETVRVVNDVVVGPPGTFLLVTGSNMAGKSTLLRAIGINVVLALAGGPVCASDFHLPPVALWTSVRVEDSLAQGVSFYLAELLRLKQIVNAARQAKEGGARRVCYLLDEILQGTNTAERQIAARRVIAFLVSSGAIGAVSTHDLSLADTPALTEAAHPVHLTESVGTGERAGLSFDYKLRPGLATSTNALRLMELVGLDLGPDSEQGDDSGPGSG